ncbi:MAG: hypothetical protein R3F59_33575 [Myxococcota bacterium]
MLWILAACAPSAVPDGIEAEASGALVAVRWRQPGDDRPGHLTFRADGGPWRDSPPATGDGGFSQWIVGVPFGSDVDYRVVQPDGAASAVRHVRTDPLPDDLPAPDVLVDGAWDADAPYLLTSANALGDNHLGRWWAFVMDRQGRVLWARESDPGTVSRHVSVAPDGRALLVDLDTFWSVLDRGASSRVVRTTLDGAVEHVYETPGLHHAFAALPDGSVAFGATDRSGEVETLQQVDPQGALTQLWACADLVGDEPCGSNGLTWDPPSGHFVFSLYSHDTVVEIDPQARAAVRWFGRIEGAWGFDPPEAQFFWQHGAVYTDAGTLLVSTKDREDGDETVAREYRLLPDAQALQQVWSFGEGRGVFGAYMGEAQRLPGGDTLHVYGEGGHMAEATPDGEVVWEADWPGERFVGHTTPLRDLAALYSLLP